MADHCWHGLRWVRLSRPAQYPDVCCRCGAHRTRYDPIFVDGEESVAGDTVPCVSDGEAREYQASQHDRLRLKADERETLQRSATQYEARERASGGYTGVGQQVLSLLDQLSRLEHEIAAERVGLRGGQLAPPYGLHELEVKALRLQQQIRSFADRLTQDTPERLPGDATPGPRAHRHVLVVNNRDGHRPPYPDLLSDHGYYVTQLPLAALASESGPDERPDLILLDCVFGQEGEGIQALHHLQRSPSTKTIPILVCAVPVTAFGDLGSYLRTKNIAMVAKPCTVEELIAAIEAVMGKTTHPPLLP